jgi:acyl-CoA thioesterase-1
MLIASLKSAVLTALFLFAFPSLASASAAAAPTRDQVIMVYGDSLSAAYGINPNEGWVSLMERALQNGSSGNGGGTAASTRKVRIVNASISGETTSGGANRIRTDLARHKPTIVVLALGANDGLRGLAVKEMRANLVKILDAIRDAGARAILVGIQIPPNYGLNYAASFRDTFAQLARERRLPLVPFLLDGIAEDLANFQPDRLHPTAAAQPRILRNVLPVVQQTLVAPAVSGRASPPSGQPNVPPNAQRSTPTPSAAPKAT